MNKVHKGPLFTTTNEVIWPKNSTFMHRQIFGNWLIGWIGHALLVQRPLYLPYKKCFSISPFIFLGKKIELFLPSL